MDDWPDIWDIPEFANIMKCIKIFSQDFDLNPSMIQVQHKKMDLDPWWQKFTASSVTDS